MELLTILEPEDIPQKGTWYALVPRGQSPSVRVGHTCTYMPQVGSDGKEKIVIVGGANPNGSFPDSHIIELDGHEWDIPLWEGLLPRYEHASFCPASCPNSLWVFGGADQCGNRNCVQVLDLETGIWRSPKIGGTAPSARTFHTSTAAIGDNLYVFGGGDKGAEPVRDTQLRVFDSAALMWAQPETHGKPPAARHGHVMVAVGTTLYIHGGLAGEKFYADMFCIDTVDMKWENVKTKGDIPSGRAAHSGVLLEEHIYIFGGMDTTGALNTMHKYHIETRCWALVKFESSLPFSRLDHSMCVIPWKVQTKTKESKNETQATAGGLQDSETVNTEKDLERQEHSARGRLMGSLDSNHKATDCERKTSVVADNDSLNLCLIFGGMNVEGEIYNDCVVTVIE